MVCLDKSNLQDHKREERRIEKSSILLLKMLEDFQQTVLLMKEHCHWVIFTDTQASYAAVSTAANSSCYCGHTYICHPYFFLLSKSAQATIICIVCPVLYQCFRRGMTLFSSPSCPLNSQYRSASKATMQSLPETSTAFRFFTSWAMEKGQSTRHRWQKPAWAAEKSNSAEGWRAEGSKRQTERERGRERDKVRERERERGKRNGSVWKWEWKLHRARLFLSTMHWNTSVEFFRVGTGLPITNHSFKTNSFSNLSTDFRLKFKHGFLWNHVWHHHNSSSACIPLLLIGSSIHWHL